MGVQGSTWELNGIGQLAKMRTFVLFFSFGSAFASDPFLQFAREHGRQYNSAAEVHLRRQIFNENYQSMQEHNARFEAGKETWRRRLRCAPRGPQTPGVGFNRAGFPPSRTRASVEAVLPLQVWQSLRLVSGSREESCLTTSPSNTLWTVS